MVIKRCSTTIATKKDKSKDNFLEKIVFDYTSS